MERKLFIDADSTPGRLESVLLASPAPADEQHPPGSSDEEDGSDDAGDKSNKGANGELATLDVGDDLDQDVEPLPLEIPSRYALVISVPAALTAELVKRTIVLWLGIEWLNGTITRQAQACTATSTTTCRFFVKRDGITHSVKLPLSKDAVDGSSGEGVWALLECLAQDGGSDKENQEGAGRKCHEEDESKDEEEDI